jgi:hypothetical protein
VVAGERFVLELHSEEVLKIAETEKKLGDVKPRDY